MTRCLYICAGLVAALLLTGCNPTNARVGVGTPPGLLITVVEAPMTAPRGGPGIILPDDYRTGHATFSSLTVKTPTFGPPIIDPLSAGWGDGSWKKAMDDGNLTEAWFADYKETKILLGIYTRYDITVYGR